MVMNLMKRAWDNEMKFLIIPYWTIMQTNEADEYSSNFIGPNAHFTKKKNITTILS